MGKPTRTIEQIVKEAQSASQVKTASAATSTETVEAAVEAGIQKEAKFPAGHITGPWT